LTTATRTHPTRADRPKLAEGLDLIGEFEDSGFKEPQYIARRADGQVVQLTQLLYQVAAEADGQRDLGEIAERVTEASGRGVSADNVGFLIDKRLRPLGVLAARDGSSPKVQRADPLLALKFRAALVPERLVRAITTLFRPLFWPPVIVLMLAAMVAFDGWLFANHGIAQSLRTLTYNPILMLMVFGLIALSAAFHECGHATACRYGGATPGVMGAGIYIVWPAFYTDVTDAYRLGKAGRLRTDLGGVYFNVIFSLGLAAVYFATGFEPLLLVILIQHMQVIYQFMPFLRLDGYYIISDLTGVPDMFARIKPVLRSLIPGREPDDRVTELKPWVRVATTVYVVMLVPALTLIFGLMILHAPRAFATAWDSFFVHIDKTSNAFGDGKLLLGAGECLQMAALVLPGVGFALTFARIGRRVSTFAWQRSEGKPTLRAGFALVAAAAIGLVAFTWWPNGEYRPIQPGEKGTLVSAVRSLKDIGTGRPALTAQRAVELKGAPAQSARFPKPKDTETSGEQQDGGKRSTQSPAGDGGSADGQDEGQDQTQDESGGQDESGQSPSGQEPQSQQPQEQTTTPQPGTETAPQEQTAPSGTTPSQPPPSSQEQPPTSTAP
jgi:putative peptide zinc metalloprotease protein